MLPLLPAAAVILLSIIMSSSWHHQQNNILISAVDMVPTTMQEELKLLQVSSLCKSPGNYQQCLEQHCPSDLMSRPRKCFVPPSGGDPSPSSGSKFIELDDNDLEAEPDALRCNQDIDCIPFHDLWAGRCCYESYCDEIEGKLNVQDAVFSSVNRNWFFRRQQEICSGLYEGNFTRRELGCKYTDKEFQKESECRTKLQDDPSKYHDINPHVSFFCDLNTRQCSKKRRTPMERSNRGHPLLIVLIMVVFIVGAVLTYLFRKRIGSHLKTARRRLLPHSRADLLTESELDVNIEDIGSPLEMEDSDTENAV